MALEAPSGPGNGRDLVVTGELDASRLDELRALFHFDEVPDFVRVDLSGATYIDAAALNVFAVAASRFPVIVVHPPRPVRHVIELCGLQGTLLLRG